jgi:hypothetical protein
MTGGARVEKRKSKPQDTLPVHSSQSVDRPANLMVHMFMHAAHPSIRPSIPCSQPAVHMYYITRLGYNMEAFFVCLVLVLLIVLVIHLRLGRERTALHSCPPVKRGSGFLGVCAT